MTKLSVLDATITTMTIQTQAGIPLGSYEPGTPEFYEVRRTRLGGSEIAAVLGLNPYESRFSLWHTKAGTITRPPDDRVQEWGKRLEPVIFNKFCQNHPDETWMYNPGSYMHHDRNWQLATPDGATPNFDKILDVKTAQNDDEWGDEGSDQIPIHIRCQILWNMNVVGASEAWIPVLIRGSIYREYWIVLDDDATADTQLLLDAGQRFIETVAEGVPPDVDSSNATREILRRLHPDIDYTASVEIAAELEHEFLMHELMYQKARDQRNTHINTIIEALGTARHATVDGRRFAYRTANLNRETGEYGLPYLRTDRKRLEQFKGRPQIKETATP